MTDLIELNDLVTDAMVRELRPGDRVESMETEGLYGTVVAIRPPLGDVIPTEEGATAEVPPKVVVQFDNGYEMEFDPVFLRVATWRWQCLDLKRV
jgi:hypothetical protein